MNSATLTLQEHNHFHGWSTPSKSLTEIERGRLGQLETTIRAGMATFVEVGNALNEISDSRLYREDFGSFAEYVEFTWGMSTPRAYQMMTAAKVVTNCREQGAPLPENEGQARALSSVPAEFQGAVLAHVARTGEVTAKRIAEAAVTVTPKLAPATMERAASFTKLQSAVARDSAQLIDALEKIPDENLYSIEADLEVVFEAIEERFLKLHPERAPFVAAMLRRLLEKCEAVK